MDRAIHQARARAPAAHAKTKEVIRWTAPCFDAGAHGHDRERMTERVLSAWVVALVAALTIFFMVPSAQAAPRGGRSSDRGWSNPRALELAKEGIDAKKAGNNQLCVEKDQASLALEDHPYVKLHLSGCLASIGKVVDALSKAKDALSAGLRNDDEELQRSAQQRVTELLPRIAHVKLQLPAESSGIKVTFDNIPVRQSLFKQKIAVDPGDHVIEAERTVKGDRQQFKERITLADGEDKAIEIVLKPSNLTQSEKECLESSSTYEEKLACVERKSTKPNVRIGLDTSGYTDSTNVHVFSPAINAGVVSPTGGWNVGGNYLVDILSAASPDIVSMASRAYKEVRYAGGVNGGYKVGPVQLSANTNVSSEPDYLSRTIGGAASIELNDKLITPRIGYNYSSDRIGIRNTPYDQFERNLKTSEFEAGVTFVLSPRTLLVTGLTFQMERGEQSKLYRYVPMFSKADAELVRRGEPYNTVNDARLNVRARELLPRERDRIAVGARVNHRLATGTLRLEERLYTDTWGILASTTDVRYLHDLSDYLRVWPHLRYHIQSSTNFYELAYSATTNPLSLPAYRTGDRELSTMMSVTAGGGARIALTAEKATTQLAIILSGEVMYSHYFESLFIKGRTALYGTVGFEVEF